MTTPSCSSSRCCAPIRRPQPVTAFDLTVLEELSGFVAVEVGGAGAELFASEAGGHRWQRIPPTEKRGRVHTSTVTVAVLDVSGSGASLPPGDVVIRTERGSGPGGQHRNKTESCVVAIHVPTGIQSRIDGRSQRHNREVAMRVLTARVASAERESASVAVNDRRRRQVGSGMRGDKVRTYREMDDRVTDHRDGRRWSLKRWRAGDWS